MLRVWKNSARNRFVQRAVFSSEKKSHPSIQENQLASTAQSIENPWKEVKDKSSGGKYYWNTRTNETTPIGAERPEHWIELDDPSGKSDLTYWWNPESKKTTSLGHQKPGSISSIAPAPQYGTLQQQQPSGIMQCVVLGFSFTAAFLIIKVLLVG